VQENSQLIETRMNKILAGQTCLSHCCPVPFFEFKHFVPAGGMLADNAAKLLAMRC